MRFLTRTFSLKPQIALLSPAADFESPPPGVSVDLTRAQNRLRKRHSSQRREMYRLERKISVTKLGVFPPLYVASI